MGWGEPHGGNAQQPSLTSRSELNAARAALIEARVAHVAALARYEAAMDAHLADLGVPNR